MTLAVFYNYLPIIFNFRSKDAFAYSAHNCVPKLIRYVLCNDIHKYNKKVFVCPNSIVIAFLRTLPSASTHIVLDKDLIYSHFCLFLFQTDVQSNCIQFRVSSRFDRGEAFISSTLDKTVHYAYQYISIYLFTFLLICVYISR